MKRFIYIALACSILISKPEAVRAQSSDGISEGTYLIGLGVIIGGVYVVRKIKEKKEDRIASNDIYFNRRECDNIEKDDELVEKCKLAILQDVKDAELKAIQKAKSDSIAEVNKRLEIIRKRSDSIRVVRAQFIRDSTRAAENQQAKAERLAWEKSMRTKYGTTNGNLIIEGKVKIGWTTTMCRESWGSPNDINRTIAANGTHEQWVYEGYNFDNSYLYFDDGILTTIQN